jgi:D-sedoheptulose 7-phosphate isomerase
MNYPERFKADIVSAVESIDLENVIALIELFKQARARGRKILVCGNTRNATTASRVLCDMMTRSSFEQPLRFRVLTLNDQTPDLGPDETAVSREGVFVEQLKNFVEPGDVVVGISALDRAALPIIRTLEYAASIGCKTAALTGLEAGKLAALADITIHVGSTHLGTVEDTHAIICHLIGSYFLEFDQC